jgi:hypothetical protein
MRLLQPHGQDSEKFFLHRYYYCNTFFALNAYTEKVFNENMQTKIFGPFSILILFLKVFMLILSKLCSLKASDMVLLVIFVNVLSLDWVNKEMISPEL